MNGGAAAARNTGLKHATGQHVTFLDDDDLYAPERLAMVADLMEEHPIVLCWFRYSGDDEGANRVINGSAEAVLAGTIPHLGSVTIRRPLCPPFDESYRASSDVEWWLRMSARRVVTVPHYGYIVRRHPGERTGYGTGERLEAAERLLRERADFFSRNRRAAAFRWRRVGIMALQIGDRRRARAALMRSIRSVPSLRSIRHLMRAVRVSRREEPARPPER